MRERARKGAREKKGRREEIGAKVGEKTLLNVLVERGEAGGSGKSTHYNSNATVLLFSKSGLHSGERGAILFPLVSLPLTSLRRPFFLAPELRPLLQETPPTPPFSTDRGSLAAPPVSENAHGRAT